MTVVKLTQINCWWLCKAKALCNLLQVQLCEAEDGLKLM
jgi:hypothetical protein